MRTVVIGSNSFSGQDFVRHSLLCGDEVLGVSRSPQKEQYQLSYDIKDSKFKFCKLDLNLDTLEIAKEITNFQPHHVVNFAAQSIVEYSWKSPADWYNTNVTSLARLLPHLCNIGSIKKYLQISTPEVYGNCTQRVLESRTYNPSTPYASSKSAADVLLDVYRKQFQFPVCTVRAANVYGSRQQLFKIIPKTIISILQGKKIPLHGGGLSTRSFVHIEDVSKAESLVLQDGVIGDIYHISHESEISIRNLVEMICQKMNKNFDECVDIAEDRKGKDSSYTLDSTKINDLGWFAKIELQEGIAETINWIREYNIHEQNLSLEYVHKQ